MVGILIELLISWLLLWTFCRQDIRALGITPNKNRMLQFAAGFLIATICCVAYQLLSVLFISNHWILNKQYTFVNFLQSSWWTFKSVLFEELIFRGALLYILIKKIGAAKACFISAVAFGFYHWFSYNVFGNPIMMLFVFIMTAIPGWIFAYSFARTMSLYLPVALHFGWNIVNIVIFSNGPLGQQLFYKANELQAQGGLSIILFVFQLASIALLTLLYLNTRFRNTLVEANKRLL